MLVNILSWINAIAEITTNIAMAIAMILVVIILNKIFLKETRQDEAK